MRVMRDLFSERYDIGGRGKFCASENRPVIEFFFFFHDRQ